VWQKTGTDLNTAETVALKYVELRDDNVKYFDREITIMLKLTHPSTHSLLGLGGGGVEGDTPRWVGLGWSICHNGTLDDMNKLFYRGSEPIEWGATARWKAFLGFGCGG
jgi:hypothetical protein